MGQFELGDFDGTGRPVEAEAQAVAGDEDLETTYVDTDEQLFPDVDDTVELAVTQVDYTVEGHGDDEQPVVHMFGRTLDGGLIHVRILEFRPYFYAPASEVTEGRLREYDRITGWEETDEAGQAYESIRGEQLVKIFGQTPRDVGQIRDDFDHYEADILFPNRLLIDKDITSGVRVPAREVGSDSQRRTLRVHHGEIEPTDVEARPRVNTFDIEVDDRSGFPEDGEETIICLTSHDSYREEYVVWIYESPQGESSPDDLSGYDPIESGGGNGKLEAEIRTFGTEEAMLDAFLEYIEHDTDPDILTGWNCLPADSEILMADGTNREIRNVRIGEEVLGTDDQETSNTTVTNKWESEREIRQFELIDGSTLRTSEDHRILVGDGEGVDWKEGRNLDPGDYVLKPRKLNVETPNVPDRSRLLSTDRRRGTETELPKQFDSHAPNRSGSEIAERSGIAAGSVHHPNSAVGTPDRCRERPIESDVTVPDGGATSRRPQATFDRQLTEPELYLAGLVLTDGTLPPDDEVRFSETRGGPHEQFPGETRLAYTQMGCDEQTVLDDAGMYAFEGLEGPPGDETDLKVDLSELYQLPERCIARFLAGVIDGRGTVSSSVTVTVAHSSTGEWYAKLFRRLGIYATHREKTVRVHDGKPDLKRLERRVLPHMNHPERVQGIETLAREKRGLTEDGPDRVPAAETRGDATLDGGDQHRFASSTERHEITREEWNEYVFVEVDAVETVGTETTYDIETTTHDFFADGCLVHNCDDFDAPYLIDRLEELDAGTDRTLDYDRLSRVDEVWRSDWQGPDIKGRVVFDLLYAYQRTQFTELDSYRLEDVGKRELGVGKERYAGDIGDLWEEDPERLLEYNLRDVELCVELDREQDIIAFWNEVRQFVGCKLEDATTPGDAVDMYVLHKLYDKFALPSKGQQDSEEYEGGAVFDPITGVRENVSVLDLKCFSGDTDVLTPEGAKNVREVEEGDRVYTLNPATFACEVKRVAETHEYQNSFGELHHLSGNTHDFKITENHRVLVSKKCGRDAQTPDDFDFVEYRDLIDSERYVFPEHRPMAGRKPETFELVGDVDGGYVSVYCDEDLGWFRDRMPEEVTEELTLAHGSSAAMSLEPKNGEYLVPVDQYCDYRETIERYADGAFLKYDRQHGEVPLSFEMDDWLELIGWYVTEGGLDRTNHRITLHRSDEEGTAAIETLLERMGIGYNTDARGVNISNRYLSEWFPNNCGKGYADKRLPSWVFELDGESLEILVETMIRGDGSTTESGLGKFWTESDSLKDDVVDLAVRTGEKPTVSRQSDGTWYVSIGKRGSFNTSTNATVEDHDGSVYCLTAEDNHVVLAGRNGHYQWVGQSLYPMCMVTTNASPETKVDPEQYGGETYRAPNGTHFRKEPDGVIRSMVDELLTEREEKKTLRNEHDPEEAEYEQYDRQQAAVKVIMNCFTPDTEVLTPAGIRNIRDLSVGDDVYSLDPVNMEMEIKPVVETHAYPDYGGELVDVQTDDIDFRVTPNHRMLVRRTDGETNREAEWEFVEAGELMEGCNYEMAHDWGFDHGERLDTVDLTQRVDGEYEVWVLPAVPGEAFTAELGWEPPSVSRADHSQEGYVFSAEEFEEHRSYIESVCQCSYLTSDSTRNWIPRTYNGDDFIELVAWYTAEGDVDSTDTTLVEGQGRDRSGRIELTRTAPAVADGGDHDRNRLCRLLDRMGFQYRVDGRSHWIRSRLLREFFYERVGDESEEGAIPEFVFESGGEQKRLFLETLVTGGGDGESDSWRFTTPSDRLRDDVVRLCTHLGLTAKYDRDGGSWRIRWSENAGNSFRLQRSGTRSRAGDGVYCVTVADNHTLVAGRNGRFQPVGQSLYGVLGWDRFRLYDKEMGAAVTATGRDVIEYTDEVVRDEGYEVVYGDTDSVMLEFGQVGSNDVAGAVEVTDEVRGKHPEMSEAELETIAATIEKGFELEDIINASYDEFALEELNAESHRFEIEFEKLYRRFFQAGKKKRYAGNVVWKEGKHVDDIDITGFEYKRSDIAPITKDVQHTVIEKIVTGEDIETVKSYLHDVIADFQEGNVDPEEVGIPGGIGKRLDNYDTDTAQVRGAKYANLLLGTNFQRGSKPKRLYLERVHADFFERIEAETGLDPAEDPLYGEFRRNPDVICFEYADQLPDAFEIDWEKMLDKTLKGPIARILEALDVSWEEVKAGQEQKGLGEFM